MQDKINHILLCHFKERHYLCTPMPKTVQACGFDLLFIYKHFI